MPETCSDADRRRRAIAHMNRGHAGLVDGFPDALDAAIVEYEQAIGLLADDAAERDASWRNSLAAAWLNRGQLLHRRHGIARATDALLSFDEAGRLLADLAGDTWPARNRIGALINRANLLLDLGRHSVARDAARTAVTIGRQREDADALDASLAVKARRTLCDAIGFLLVAPGVDARSLADEASEAVDEALELARRWEQRAPSIFRPLRGRLFRYGAELYRRHQPHFLAEFIRENSADPRPAGFAEVARENVVAALRVAPATPWLTVGDPASERFVATARELEMLRQELAAVSSQIGMIPSNHG
ncbi:MAG TPA: hypothetical protein VGM73_18180 [Candidatus Didemnitutus sp.]